MVLPVCCYLLYFISANLARQQPSLLWGYLCRKMAMSSLVAWSKARRRHSSSPVVFNSYARISRNRVSFTYLVDSKGPKGNMLSTSIYPLIACFSCTLLAKPVQSVNDLGDLRQPSHPSSLLSAFNATSLVNVSVSNDMSIRCDGEVYGFKPDINDCMSALQHHQIGREQASFGRRGSFRSEKTIPLPYRMMGGT